MIMDTIKRYVIRRVKEQDYYAGNNTWSSPFEDFDKAKVFKNLVGAKVSCLNIYEHRKYELEIVEIETRVTDKIIKYKYE